MGITVAGIVFIRQGPIRKDAAAIEEDIPPAHVELSVFTSPAGVPLFTDASDLYKQGLESSPAGIWYALMDKIPTDFDLLIATSPLGARIRVWHESSFWYVGLSPVFIEIPPGDLIVYAELAGHDSARHLVSFVDWEPQHRIDIPLKRSVEKIQVALDTPSGNNGISAAPGDSLYTYHTSKNQLSVSDASGNHIALYTKVTSPPTVFENSVAFARRWELGDNQIILSTFGYLTGADITLTHVSRMLPIAGDPILYPMGRFGLLADGDAVALFDLYESRLLWQQAIHGDWVPRRSGDILILASSSGVRLYDVFSGMDVLQQEVYQTDLAAR